MDEGREAVDPSEFVYPFAVLVLPQISIEEFKLPRIKGRFRVAVTYQASRKFVNNVLWMSRWLCHDLSLPCGLRQP